MARPERFGNTRRQRNERDEVKNADHFQVAYVHYVARCKSLGVDPMPPEELRELLASAHAKTDTRRQQT